MTLAVDDAIDKYTAVGAEPSFSYAFPLEEVIAPAAHYVVVQVETAGVLATLVEGVDYSVTGAGNPLGGTILLNLTAFPFGAVAATKWTIYRDNPLSRLTDFQISGDFFAVEVNKQMDYITQITQDFGRDRDYSIKLPLSGSLLNIDAPAPVALGVWRWNALADGLETTLLSATSASTDIVLDLTPQLGGNLDVNGKKFVTVSNGNIHLEPNGTGRAGIGLAPTTGLLHVQSSSIGAVTANADADEAVFENSGNSGISIFSGATGTGNVVFGDGGSNAVSVIQYNHNVNKLLFTVNASADERIGIAGGETVINEVGADYDFRVESDDNASKFKLDAGTDLVQVAMGTASTALANVGGVLYSNAANVQTTAVTTEETLKTYTLPANSLSVNGKGIRLKFAFTAAGNTNSKTMKVYWGSSLLFNITTTTAGWIAFAEILIMRRGASDQLTYTPGLGFESTAGVFLLINSSAQDETAGIVIKMTGQNGVATAGDIIAQHMIVEALE